MTEQDVSLKPHRAKIYSFYKKFSPSYAAAIMFDIDPYFLQKYSFPDVKLLEELLRHLVENKEFNSAEFVCDAYGDDWCESISSAELKEWALKSGYSWSLPDNPKENATQGNKEIVKEQSQEIERLKAENAELRSQLQDNAQQQSAVDSEPSLENTKTTRISQPQRDIFSLLVIKNYHDQPSRNSLFDAINADLEATGISNKSVSYQTFDNLIDEALRLTKTSLDGNQIQYSPFPSKITK